MKALGAQARYGTFSEVLVLKTATAQRDFRLSTPLGHCDYHLHERIMKPRRDR
jgi:hypothetical protein